MSRNFSPKVSIIVTSYNIEKYIESCLDTVVNQTLKDIEIIIVDDGSSDTTPQILTKYAERDDRIKLILFEDNTIGGVSSAANAGIEAATGQYIGFADGDDLYDLTMFEKLYDAAEDNQADVSMCNYHLLNDETGKLTPPADDRRWNDLHGSEFLELDTKNKKKILMFISVPWRKLYRGDLLRDNEIRFPVGDYFFEDNPFHWYTTLKAERIAIVPEKLCQHRMFRVGQTMATADRKLLKMFEHHRTIIGWLKKEGLFDKYESDALSWLTSQIEWISNKIDETIRDDFFDAASSELKLYSAATVKETLDRKKTGYTGRLKTVMLHEGNRAGFMLAYNNPRENLNLLHQAWLHYKMYGFKDLMRIIKERYIEPNIPEKRLSFSKKSRSNELQKMDEKLDAIIIGIQILEQKIQEMRKR